MDIENERKFDLRVRKFAKIADFDKWAYELLQALSNKRKNANKRRFTLNGDPNGIYSGLRPSPTRAKPSGPPAALPASETDSGRTLRIQNSFGIHQL